MEVILKENVDGLGFMGEVVSVKPGYARNYLLPQNLAVVATKASKKMIEHEQRQIDLKIRRLMADAVAVKEQLEQTRITVLKKAGEQNKLYGSVTGMDIEAALKNQGFGGINRKQVVIAEPIKALGDFKVEIRLLPDVVATLKLTVEPESGEAIKYEETGEEGASAEAGAEEAEATEGEESPEDENE